MPLDPQAARYLEHLATVMRPTSGLPDLTQARALSDAGLWRTPGEPEQVAHLEDRTITSTRGTIPIRIYTPSGEGPFPILLYLHGGGWVMSNHNTDASTRSLTNQSGCIVVSVDYRLAPEHKFPAGLDDCYTALKWAHQNAHLFNGDAGRLAVGGDSAGGNLAAALCLLARNSEGPSLAFQLLVGPVLDHSYTTASWQEYGEKGYVLTRQAMEWFWDLYVTDEMDWHNLYAAPLRVKDLSHLPSALIIAAECDPLHDEGELYAQRLRDAGVPATFKSYAGMIHNFFLLPTIMDGGKQAIADAAQALRTALY